MMNDNKALRPKGVEPDVHRVGGVLILVRGRESPPQAKGNSSNVSDKETPSSSIGVGYGMAERRFHRV